MARQGQRDDPRGAIKARAVQARFPFLAANLVDAVTGRRVEWPNVQPGVLVNAAGIKVGIIGVMTVDALRATLPANVVGLRVTPLVPAIVEEASKLRAGGANLVIVAAHAGGRCTRFDPPTDLSTCDAGSEIFQVAASLPPGLVDVIAAGHTHEAVAHEVEGIAIVQGLPRGQSFGRVDVAFDRTSNRIAGSRLFAPREVCAVQDPASGNCNPPAGSAAPLPPARYEHHVVNPDSAVAHAMEPVLQRVRALQATPLGVRLDTPIRREGDLESPLGNLFADALRESVAGADVAVNNNAAGGLRADLPEGPLTFGRLYDVFPFDNRLLRFTLTGAELRRVFVEEIRRGRRGALGISGVRLRATCPGDTLSVDLLRTSGVPIDDAERLVVVAMDSLASGVVFAPVRPPGGFSVPEDAPVLREVVEDWFRRRAGHLTSRQFIDPDDRRWEYPDTLPLRCASR
jgi:5'-nucleotidase